MPLENTEFKNNKKNKRKIKAQNGCEPAHKFKGDQKQHFASAAAEYPLSGEEASLPP